jgi:AAA domain
VKPEFSYHRGIARCAWADPALEMKFDLLRLDRRSGELSAEVTVLSQANGHGGLLHRARLNLGSTRSRAEVVNHLARRLDGPDWSGLLEVASWKVIEAYRQGAPAFLLRDAVEPPAVGWALKPLAIASDAVIFFGDGGAVKSYTVLALAVALQRFLPMAEGLDPARDFRVAYLDFEWSAWPHLRRLRALCGPGQLPDILYVPCQSSGPLTHQVERLQRVFEEHRIDFAIVDSVGLACDGPPEEAQSAIGFFQALARLEVGSALVAHTSKDSDTMKPFGSTYWHNSARMTWYVKRVRTMGTSGIDVGLYNRKYNDGAVRVEPIGLHFAFAEGATTISKAELGPAQVAVDDSAALKTRLVVARRMSGTSMTFLQLAVAVGLPATDRSVDTVRKTVRRAPDVFAVDEGGVGRAHLVNLVGKEPGQASTANDPDKEPGHDPDKAEPDEVADGPN